MAGPGAAAHGRTGPERIKNRRARRRREANLRGEEERSRSRLNLALKGVLPGSGDQREEEEARWVSLGASQPTKMVAAAASSSLLLLLLLLLDDTPQAA